MSHVDLPLQKAVYDILNGDATLGALITGVFDGVPDNQEYPYVSIANNDNFNDNGSHTTDGFQGIKQIDVWSRSDNTVQTKTIQNRIYQLLHNIDINVVDFTTTTFRCNLTNISLDPDGKTYHGVQQFGFIFGYCP